MYGDRLSYAYTCIAWRSPSIVGAMACPRPAAYHARSSPADNRTILAIYPGYKLVKLAVLNRFPKRIVCIRYLSLQFRMEKKDYGTNTNNYQYTLITVALKPDGRCSRTHWTSTRARLWAPAPARQWRCLWAGSGVDSRPCT